MEELPLGTQPFHHVHAFSAEETNVAASDVDGEFFPERALQGEKVPNQSLFINEEKRSNWCTRRKLLLSQTLTSGHYKCLKFTDIIYKLMIPKYSNSKVIH